MGTVNSGGEIVYSPSAQSRGASNLRFGEPSVRWDVLTNERRQRDWSFVFIRAEIEEQKRIFRAQRAERAENNELMIVGNEEPAMRRESTS